MGVGKYSPTVSAAYSVDQEWHKRHSDTDQWYDRDGYDSYGYNSSGVDRAGYSEFDYMINSTDDLNDQDLYYEVYVAWSFDGIKPVVRHSIKTV